MKKKKNGLKKMEGGALFKMGRKEKDLLFEEKLLSKLLNTIEKHFPKLKEKVILATIVKRANRDLFFFGPVLGYTKEEAEQIKKEFFIKK